MKKSEKARKAIWLLVISIIISALGLFIYIKLNPPLHSDGVSSARSDACKSVEIINSGCADISLESVLVNNGERPMKVELGVSRADHLVLGAGLDEDPYITFHDIREYKINPVLSVKERKTLAEKKDREIIKHYGLRISHDKPLERIIIIYRYLGIQFHHGRDVRI